MSKLTFLFRLIKGRCHGNQFRGKVGKIGLLTFIHRTDIQKRFGILQWRWKLNSGDDLAKNLVNFGPVTPEFFGAQLCTAGIN